MDKTPPSDQVTPDRETLLGEARLDLAYANENKITYEDLAKSINQAIGTKWDKGAVRRFIRSPDGVRGAIHGNSLQPDQVSALRQLAAHIKAEVDTGYRKPFTLPLITKFREVANEVIVPLSAEQAKLLQEDPKLAAILEATLQITTAQVLKAYQAGQNNQLFHEAPAAK